MEPALGRDGRLSAGKWLAHKVDVGAGLGLPGRLWAGPERHPLGLAPTSSLRQERGWERAA